ncbi:hypothetical protein GUJ93_ZPchr0012g22079 [Zizania palustris]|uniref:Uncharacterized protein n=1 Tax=Zizania palustris TaxID=103762 RepID=A0A8J5WQ00_ZIZPA|nr:hypothetical protein GUJ93_ZPchr0012g22079 [Zizania palustris]
MMLYLDAEMTTSRPSRRSPPHRGRGRGQVCSLQAPADDLVVHSCSRTAPSTSSSTAAATPLRGDSSTPSPPAPSSQGTRSWQRSPADATSARRGTSSRSCLSGTLSRGTRYSPPTPLRRTRIILRLRVGCSTKWPSMTSSRGTCFSPLGSYARRGLMNTASWNTMVNWFFASGLVKAPGVFDAMPVKYSSCLTVSALWCTGLSRIVRCVKLTSF